tara:strand:- start:17 stop:175 length:159 start_codon:yes stop_codon:yes gene_type:complete
MTLAKASILELEKLDLRNFEEGQKFHRIAKQLQAPERNALISHWKKKVEGML